MDHYTSNKDCEQIKDERVGKDRKNSHCHKIEGKADNVENWLEDIGHQGEDKASKKKRNKAAFNTYSWDDKGKKEKGEDVDRYQTEEQFHRA